MFDIFAFFRTPSPAERYRGAVKSKLEKTEQQLKEAQDAHLEALADVEHTAHLVPMLQARQSRLQQTLLETDPRLPSPTRTPPHTAQARTA